MVFFETSCSDLLFHLGAGHTPAVAHGSAHGVGLEIHGPDVIGDPPRRRHLASAARGDLARPGDLPLFSGAGLGS